MSRFVQPVGSRGSLKWIQRGVNHHEEVLDWHLHEAGVEGQIRWLAPLVEDAMAEYRDADFLHRLELSHLTSALAEFWPRGGPQWDALARTDRNEILLIEAKAHIGEVCSPGTQAGTVSATKIERALAETAAFLGATSKVVWTETFYQLANRLAHLYFLRQNEVDARLVLVNFVGDEEMRGPLNAREWAAAYQVVHHVMGLSNRHPLSRFVLHVYPDVAELQ